MHTQTQPGLSRLCRCRWENPELPQKKQNSPRIPEFPAERVCRNEKNQWKLSGHDQCANSSRNELSRALPMDAYLSPANQYLSCRKLLIASRVWGFFLFLIIQLYSFQLLFLLLIFCQTQNSFLLNSPKHFKTKRGVEPPLNIFQSCQSVLLHFPQHLLVVYKSFFIITPVPPSIPAWGLKHGVYLGRY